jgi:hypothetical protein
VAIGQRRVRCSGKEEATMSDSEKQRNDGEERPARAPEPEPKAADTEAIGLSIEERGMVVMPQVSVPVDQIDVGNMPRADASPAGSEGTAGSGGEGGSESGDAAAGKDAGD